ncbi:MAG: prepilin-type N-terminal cleavage/methylation domain-containing protein [Mariprofundaceae bacterium]|nr:prepilin-type N-terminal cleavage/methylation domain-containing protein [Mariprofundaceae bacterium]
MILNHIPVSWVVKPVKAWAGFTLIEILLVLTMMAIISALIAPSFFSASGGTVTSETRKMQKILRMVGEESQLGGMPIQLRVYRDSLNFYSPNKEKKWQPLANTILQAYALRSPVYIAKAQLDGGAGIMMDEQITMGEQNDSNGKTSTPTLARFLFWPDGDVTAGEITLQAGSENQTIRIDAGMGGVRVIDKEKQQ